MKVKFKQWTGTLRIGAYDNGRLAFELWDDEPIAVCTVNIPEEKLFPDEIIIKDYAENGGMYQALNEAGLVGTILRYVQTGFVKCPVAKITQKMKDELEKKADYTEEQKKVYLADTGKCPKCQSTDISGDGFDMDGDQDQAWQPCRCSTCGEQWNDSYKLVDVQRRE